MKDYHIPRHMCAVPLKDKNEFIINLQFRDFAPSSNFILFLSSDVFQIGFSRGRHRSADIIALSDPSEFSANTYWAALSLSFRLISIRLMLMNIIAWGPQVTTRTACMTRLFRKREGFG